jgi:beta-glucosidase
MTFEEKLRYTGGTKGFYLPSVERFGLREVRLSDATQGINGKHTIAYPCAVALAATWDAGLAERYGAAIGSECRVNGVDILLGPGFNLYRNALCGRNFEYMGEDPFLAGTIACGHVRGVQSRKVMATAKHFICNNHEWLRKRSDVVIDRRTLREFYGYPWYKVVNEARVGAVMGSYNLVNGEKVCQSHELIAGLLRSEMGFAGLCMSDWMVAVSDGRKAMLSGLDLEMPDPNHIKDMAAKGDMPREEVERCLNRMVTSTLTACFAFGIHDRPAVDLSFSNDLSKCEAVALETARGSVTLLKNRDGLLPIDATKIRRVLVTGPYAKVTPHAGGGSGGVRGYDHRHILAEMEKVMGTNVVVYSESPATSDVKAADAVVVCVGVRDSEGSDGSFDLEAKQNTLIDNLAENNPNTIVVLIAGRAVGMDPWHEKVGGLVCAYYAGQYGGTAITEVLAGKINPSGRLPFSIERRFAESPAADYTTQWKRVQAGMEGTNRKGLRPGDPPVPDFPKVLYEEGAFVGYRWYDQKDIAVRYPFGHGLSYTHFEMDNLKAEIRENGMHVTVTVSNTGSRVGAEVVQVYVRDCEASVPRPRKELKAFEKVVLNPNERKIVSLRIAPEVLAFYDERQSKWKLEAGDFDVMAGASSQDIRVRAVCRWPATQWFEKPVAVQDRRP